MTRCTCRVAQPDDYDVVRGHADVGQLIECAGHVALRTIKLKLNKDTTMNKPARSYEAGDFDGRPEIETLERMRRTEIRLNRFFRWAGHSQMGSTETPDNVRCIAKDGALYATSPAVTLGMVSEAAASNNLTGDVPLYVGSHYWGEVRI